MSVAIYCCIHKKIKINSGKVTRIYTASKYHFEPKNLKYVSIKLNNCHAIMSDTNFAFWNEKYKSGQTPWQLDIPSPPIIAYISQLKDKNLKILIPGAGQGFELDYLVLHGFSNIHVCDIVPHAIESLSKRIGNQSGVKYITGDFFELNDTYDLILEQTFFCAINPDLRKAYVDKIHTLLKKDGKIAGVLFATHFVNDGPPFGGTMSVYKELFQQKLHIKIMDMCYNSAKPRKGNELFFICEKTTDN